MFLPCSYVLPRFILAVAACCCLLVMTKASTSCTLCPDGLPIDPALATKTLPFLKQHFGYSNVSTCSEWEFTLSVGHNATSPHCADAQALSTICGCARPDNSCTLCLEGQNFTDPNRMVPFLQEWYGFVPTCDLWDAVAAGLQEDTTECLYYRVYSDVCGCQYFDFDTDFWITLCRTSGTISLVASLSLLVYLVKDCKKKTSTYHQIIMAISSSDVLSSIWFILADIPQPDYLTTDGRLVETDNAFCTAQGWFIQFAFTAMFYNVSLTLFYMLTIAEGWTPSKIQRVQKILLGIPLVIGMILACAGIPFYQALGALCHLPTNFMAEVFGWSHLPTVFLTILPVCLSIALITAMQIRIFWKVRQLEQRVLKWRFTGKTQSNSAITMTEREQQVFWQSVFYVGSFYMVWPIVLAANVLRPERFNDPASAAYNLKSVAYFFWPLQGLFNFLVYFRPKILRVVSRAINSVSTTLRSTNTSNADNCDP